MVKCPKCNEEIHELNFDVTATCSSYVKENQTTDYDLDALTDCVEFDNFSCPECSEVIASSEQEALEFLNNLKVKNEI